MKLRLNHEFEIINKVLKYNNNIFFIEDREFEKWLKNHSVGKKLPIKPMKNHYYDFSLQNNLSAENYINITEPDIFSRDEFNNRPIKIFKYHLQKTLNEGDYFGEISIMDLRKKRSTTAMTSSECEFGTIQRDIYHKLLKELLDKDAKVHSQFLTNTKLFSGLDSITFKIHHYPHFEYYKLKKGTILQRENDMPEFIYFIERGEFSINKFFSIKEFNLALRYYNNKTEVPDLDDEMKMASN